ncbi:uncharacterized protein LOC135474064 [Liolophura sinensis]|uniref:uncharacterized protein LOC135474064 n=1 Tax=Liolophura sinensis TaxID=3198878 RepID=UPI0031592327
MAVDVTKQPPPVPIDNTIDIEKISSSHFTVGHDLSIVKDSMKSIFKLDFPFPKGSEKTLPSDPPVLGQVMHKDTKFFKDDTSETINSFQYRYLPKPDLQYDHDTIGQTNFKMDRDVKKIDSFKTINRLHFPPLVDEGYAVVRPPCKGGWHPNCIPQGDPSKEHQQLSDYKEKFRGHDTRVVKVPRISSKDNGELSTVKGDKRMVNFTTSCMDTFQGRWLPRVPAVPVPRIISVPQGDPEKIVTKSTTMWDSYPQTTPNSKPDINFDLEKATRKMRKSNHHDKASHDSCDDFQTVAKTAFPQKQCPVERFRPAFRRNHSDFPAGDLDPERSRARLTDTTNNFHFGNPALNHINPILSGSDFITKSKLIFGEPRLGASYYDTSMGQTYVPKASNTWRVPMGSGKHSVVLSGYPTGKVNETTTSCDFQNPKQGRLRPNPQMIKSLSDHHIHPPLNEQDFLTTHKDTFVSKTTAREPIDPHKLQVSSVPLGTLTTQEPKYGDNLD